MNSTEGYVHNVTKTRVLTADSVDIDTMNGDWIATIDKDTFFTVPFFHKPDDWKEDEGFVSAIYVENERGKTVHSVRSVCVEEAEGIPLAIDDGDGPVQMINRSR